MTKEFILHSITLYNMFNYRNKHTIDFTGGKPGNVFLFDVKNGGGKTSLFFSMKWGFYGFDSGVSYVKDGVTLHAADFMNQDEREEGSFRVIIEFSYDGKQMKLRRSCPDYHSEKTELTITVDGMVERDERAKEIVMKILPPDYGDFFMFDGETLQKIASQQGDRNKTDNVMKLLGLSQLRELKSHLISIQKAISTEFTGMQNANAHAKGLMDELSRLQDKEKRVGEKLEAMRKRDSEIREQIFKLEEERRRYSNIQSTIKEIAVKKGELKAAELELEHIRGYIRENSQNAFMIFMEPDVRRLVDKYEGELKRLKRESNVDRRVNNEFVHIQNRMLTEHMESCPVCSSLLTDEIIQYLLEVVGQSKDKGELFKKHRDEVNQYSHYVSILKAHLSLIPEDLNGKCDELFKTSSRIDDLNARIDELNLIAADSDLDAVREVSTKLSKLYKEQSELKKDIFQQENVLETTSKRLIDIRKKIEESGALSDQQKIVSSRMCCLDRLIKRLGSVIDNISRDKRADILSEANRVFMSITNKQDVYGGLAYDDSSSFSMHIVRKDGVRSVLPSSGESHVLAISFLISLSLNTERLTPMMMDTPLSRLDNVHKPNIGRMLASLNNQVIFLAQPGELDDNTRMMLMPSVSKMYVAEPTDNNSACITEVDI